MTLSKKKEIADAADMIVGGYAYKRNGQNIRVVNLNKTVPGIMTFTEDGNILESSMDPIERQIAIDRWDENKEFMDF